MRFFCLTPFLASKQGLCVHIFLFLTSNYYQSHCVISHHLTQQMAIFHPITPHLLSPLYPSSLKHCYILPRLTPLSCFSSSVYHLTPLRPPPPFSAPPTVLGSISRSWCSSHPCCLCPLSVPELLSLRTFAESLVEQLAPVTRERLSSSSFHFPNLLFQHGLSSLTLILRWRTVCWDVRWLHGAGLCHLSHSWQASSNQDRAAWLPLAERWDILGNVGL